MCLTWRGLVQHLNILQADGEAEVLGYKKSGLRCPVGLLPCERERRSRLGFVRAKRRRRLKRLPSIRKWMLMPSGRSSFASRNMMLKKMENNVGPERIPA